MYEIRKTVRDSCVGRVELLFLCSFFGGVKAIFACSGGYSVHTCFHKVIAIYALSRQERC